MIGSNNQQQTQTMESLVLCPEELCLGPAAAAATGGAPGLTAPLGVSPAPAADLSICANEALEKGTKFLPWKGTVRSDKLPVFERLPEFDVRRKCINGCLCCLLGRAVRV